MTDGASRRRANFFRGAMRDPEWRASPHTVPASTHLTDDERATAQPVIEAKVEEFAANLPPRAKALIVAAALQNPSLAQQMRAGGISFTSSIVQNAVQAALSDVQAGRVTELNMHTRRADEIAQSVEGGHEGHRPRPVQGAFMAMDRDMRGNNSRYEGLSSSDRLSLSDLGKIAEARGVAEFYGMGWMQPRDLLAVGSAGVRAMAEVQIDRQSFRRLRTDGRFEARDVVTLAQYAKRQGIQDARPLANATANLVQLGATPAEHTEIKNTITGFMARPEDPVAQQRHNEMLRRLEARPGGVATVRNYEEQARITRQSEHAATTTGQVKNTTRLQATADRSAVSNAFGVSPSTGNPPVPAQNLAPAPASQTDARKLVAPKP